VQFANKALWPWGDASDENGRKSAQGNKNTKKNRMEISDDGHCRVA
jgi:hypothetical protein